jgi:hypothetical protein
MISAHLRAISDELEAARRRALGPGDPGGTEPDDATAPGESMLLSLDDGIKLKSGSCILAPAEGEDPSWCVLSSFLEDDTGAVEYLMKGELGAELDVADFLSVAYRLVLDREIDAQGLRAYSAMLAHGRVARFDVLRTLADSDEATALARPLIILPKTMIDPGLGA